MNPLIMVWTWLRRQAREAVLAGVADAVDDLSTDAQGGADGAARLRLALASPTPITNGEAKALPSPASSTNGVAKALPGKSGKAK